MTVLRTFHYEFSFLDQSSLVYTISLDPVSHHINVCPITPPPWADLLHHQCSPCSLKTDTHPYCPVALVIAELVEKFKNTASYTPCTVSCTSAERIVSKETVVQDGLSSILGLLMATSGCPIMDFFRPMARFHLPFSTVDESIFRVTATYLLHQYYLNQGGDSSTFSLFEMKSHFTKVKEVNRGMLERILDVAVLDADRNAIVTLNSLAQILEMEIDANIESLRFLFTNTE